MSLNPSLRIGLWNAWILMIYFMLQPFIVRLIDKFIGNGEIYQKLGGESADPRQLCSGRIATILLYTIVGVSIFIPLRSGTAWLAVGLMIYMAGIFVFLSAILTAAKTLHGEVFTIGIYRYSRHPLYLSSALVLIGVSVSAASWIMLLFAGAYIFLTFSTVPEEEQACLVAFGDRYREYMDTTPRWLGIPRSAVGRTI